MKIHGCIQNMYKHEYLDSHKLHELNKYRSVDDESDNHLEARASGVYKKFVCVSLEI